MPAWVVEWAPVAPWLVAVVVIVLGGYKLAPFFRKVGHFMDDVQGEAARPGVPARPGLMERLAVMETKQDEHGKKLDIVHHEVFPNSGQSFRDQTDKTLRAVKHIAVHSGISLEELEQTLNPKGTA